MEEHNFDGDPSDKSISKPITISSNINIATDLRSTSNSGHNSRVAESSCAYSNPNLYEKSSEMNEPANYNLSPDKKFISLQSLISEKENKNILQQHKGFLLSSGSDEMLVVPAGVMAYFSSESDDRLPHGLSYQEEESFVELSQHPLRTFVSQQSSSNEKYSCSAIPDGLVFDDAQGNECLEIQPPSLGSQSENTDSVATVLDVKSGCSNSGDTNNIVGESRNEALTALKPNFIVGGLMSPRTVKVQKLQDAVRDRMSDYKITLEGSSDPTSLEHYGELMSKPFLAPLVTVSEQESSLISFMSVGSTQPPDSSERATSPSALSVSSAASSKKLEWDSAADVGYQGTNTHASSTSLSTLERITIGKCASNILKQEDEMNKVPNLKARNRYKKPEKGNYFSSSLSFSDVPGIFHKKQNLLDDRSLPGSSKSGSMKKLKPPSFPPSSSDEENSKVSNVSQSPRRKLRKRSEFFCEKESSCASKSSRCRRRSTSNSYSGSAKLANPRGFKGEVSKPVAMERKETVIGNSSKVVKSESLDFSKFSRKFEQEFASCVSLNGEKKNSAGSFDSLPTQSTPNVPGNFDEKKVKEEEAAYSKDEVFSSSCIERHQKVLPAVQSQNRGILLEYANVTMFDEDIHDLTQHPVISTAQEYSNLSEMSEAVNFNVSTTLDPGMHYKQVGSSKDDLVHDENHQPSNTVSGNEKQEPISQLDKINDSTSELSSYLLQSVADETGPINSFLFHLSLKLSRYVENLVEKQVGLEAKESHHYKKLMEYIEFIGCESSSSEEIKLKQEVAELIVDLCGQIQTKHEEEQLTNDSETCPTNSKEKETGKTL